MNVKHVIEELMDKYSGKNIIKLPPEKPAEIICETEPTTEGKTYSKVIAIIDRSSPHFHQKTKEIYKVIKGSLELFVENKTYTLVKDDIFTIEPLKVHWAIGKETWIEAYSEPGWTQGDHIIV